MDYTIYSDFENYVKENENLLNFLESNNSLLNEIIAPITKTLYYIINQEKNLSDNKIKDNESIFEFGFKYFFENVEQIKLYLRQLNNDYEHLEKMSYYIKIIFILEELKVEIEKKETLDLESKQDITHINEALDYFEEYIVPNVGINEYELNKYLDLYYELLSKYSDVVLMTDAFNEFCATYGI